VKNPLPLLILPLAITVQAQPSSCSSDGVPQPTALLERFINADCETCWRSPQAPEPGAGALAIDWVAEGSRGDDAPLAAVATRDGGDRLDALGRKVPAESDTRFTQRSAGAFKVRVAHGLPVNDYIGTSIEMHPPTGGPWKAWLLLVETLPKGTAGSSVERNLVRNAFVAEWQATGRDSPGPRYELRPMRIAEGADARRLRVVGWLEDSQGNVRAIAQSRCRKP
jgi:hypothetical protein